MEGRDRGRRGKGEGGGKKQTKCASPEMTTRPSGWRFDTARGLFSFSLFCIRSCTQAMSKCDHAEHAITSGIFNTAQKSKDS